MSRHMQQTIVVRSCYDKDLEGTYPRLARYLSHQDSNLVKQNPSLYKLAGQLDQLLYQYDGTPLREVLLKHGDTLRSLYKEIEKNIADWQLSQADKLLYRIEDVFDEIEAELD